MKKLFWVVIASVCLIFVGPAFAAEKPIEMRLAYLGQSGAEDDVCAKEFARVVGDNSGGKIKVMLYPNEQLGKEVDMVTAQELNSLEMGIYGFTLFQQAAPKYNIWSAYYLFDNVDELLALVKGPIGERMNKEILKNKGIRVIGYGPRGKRNLTSNRPIRTPADCKGLKIRVPLQPIYVESWKALGALPTSIAFAEVYTSLKQGIVEAQENPYAYIYAGHFYEVQKYCNLTEHQVPFFTYAVTEKFFQRLSPDLQKVILDAGEYITGFHTKLQKDNDQVWVEKLKKGGMTFIEVDKPAFRKALAHIPEMFKDKWVPNLYEDIEKELAVIRKK